MKIGTYVVSTLHIWKMCVAYIKQLSASGGNVRVRIDTKPHPKSERQLGYVWACLYPFLQQYLKQRAVEHNAQLGSDVDDIEILNTNITIDDIHLYHVELFNEQTATGISKAIDLGLGLGPRIIKHRMSDWNAGQMAAYIEWILGFYAVRSVELPEADAFWRERGIKNSRSVVLPEPDGWAERAA